MSKSRLHRVSRVMPGAVVDTVAEDKRRGESRAFDVLYRAQECWMRMEKFRRDRERNKNYTYGRQWDDIVCVDGERMRESDLIQRQGNLPLKNNLIRRMVRNVKGVWRGQATEPTCTARDRDEQQYGETMSTVLQCNMDLNGMKELNAHSLEEFLISGVVVHKKTFGWRREEYDCWTDYVAPYDFFIDGNMRDVRGWDVSCIGEVHDVDFRELAHKYAKSAEEYARLSRIYADAKDRQALSLTYEEFGYTDTKNYDFLTPRSPELCRVIEVWQKESKGRYRCHDMNSGELYKIEEEAYAEEVEAENARRRAEGLELGIPEEEIPYIRAEWFVDSYWYYYILTPFGDILDEGETPYDHKEHPYVFVIYPFIDGEVHSYVADVIDQQRYVNRLIMLYDFIMKTSAKGALMFPEDSLPEDMSMDEIAEEWTRADGIIVFRPSKSGMMPKQVSANCTQIGISELLNMQLKLFEDISGVNGAIQGKPGFSGMSASLYHQQTQNATTSLLDLLDTFGAFTREGALKDVMNIQQCYDGPKVGRIAGRKGATVVYDPDLLGGVRFDVRMVDSTATPSYRAHSNEFLMKLFEMNRITLQQLLEQGDFPFADSLLQSIASQEAALAAGGEAVGMPPEVMEAAASGADMGAVDRGREMLLQRI